MFQYFFQYKFQAWNLVNTSKNYLSNNQIYQECSPKSHSIFHFRQPSQNYTIKLALTTAIMSFIDMLRFFSLNNGKNASKTTKEICSALGKEVVSVRTGLKIPIEKFFGLRFASFGPTNWDLKWRN